MPSFEQMQKIYGNTQTIGEQIKQISDTVVNDTFSNSITYRKGYIYDCEMNPLQMIEFKFLKVYTYTIEKNQVEYMIQFRPNVCPEVEFDTSKDQLHRLGYYIDIENKKTKEIEKWLIVGKDEGEQDKYNVLKCNWEFEWLDLDRNYHKVLGCERNVNSYNSGVGLNKHFSVVENQMSMIIPTNNHANTIDYGVRFIISDNNKRPKVYEVTKIIDTLPLGITQVTLVQALYNKNTDFYGTDKDLIEKGIKPFFNDDNIHRVANFIKSVMPHEKPKPDITNLETVLENNISWSLSKVNEKLYVNGQAQTITAIPSVINENKSCDWHIFIDNEDYTEKLEELKEYLDIQIDSLNNKLTIAAINRDLAKYVVSIKIYDNSRTYYDSVEMEVCI